MSQLRSRIHHPFLVVGRRTVLRADYLRPALTAARTSGALLLLPHTIFQDLAAASAPSPAREALARYPAQLAVARPPWVILEHERRTGVATQHHTDDDGWRRLRAFLEGREPAVIDGDAAIPPLPTLPDDAVAELVAAEGAPLPERLASPRTTRILESVLKSTGADPRLASLPSFSAHYLLAQAAALLLPPERLDAVDFATIALAAVSLDYVTADEDARALFQDVTLAVDLRHQASPV